jgi:hypothetical protein
MTKFVIRCNGGPMSGDRVFEDGSLPWTHGWPPPEQLSDGMGGMYELESYSDLPPTDPATSGVIRGARYVWRTIA